MDGERWSRIQELFHAALERPESERRAYVEAGADDAALAADVLRLLEADARETAQLLDRGVAEAAHDVFDASVPPVQRIGPYRVVRPIGQGGMGVVYLGERDDLGSRAAIKVLRDASLSPARRARFLSEQRTLAQLDHPDIARLYDADTLADGTPWFAMEYVEGESLTTYAASRGLTIRQRLELFRAVCEAVQYAHRHAIVHRDLKPSNIMVRTDGVVKLLDFGIAKQLEDMEAGADPTQTALRLMTPAYAAPEQILGQAVGTYTDVYALGVILYELVAGRPPYELSKLTPARAEALIVDTTPDRPSVAAASTGRAGEATRSEWSDLDVLCLTAMHRDVQRRYRTVDALLRDVDHFLHREPLEAHPDSAAYRASRFLRRNWRGVAGTAAVLALLLGVSGVYAVRLAAARDAALVEAARAQRVQRFVLDLFRGGDDAAGPADSLRVVTLLDRGVRETHLLASEPRVQADVYETLGTVFLQLGELARADTLLGLALERRLALFGDHHPDVASSRIALAELRSEQANYEEAERLARAAVEAGRRHAGPSSPATLRGATALARALQHTGRYDEAMDALNAVVAGSDRENPALPSALFQLASTHLLAGSYAVADSLNRLLLDMNVQRHGERHPAVAEALINLGAVQAELGRPEETERLYREALAINEAFHGPDHPTVASNLTVLARVLLQQRKVDEAEGLLVRALAARERIYGPVHPAVASTANELGVIAQFREDYPAAERWYGRMASIYEQTLDQPHYLSGIALSNLAGVYYDADDIARAERSMTPAVEIFMETLGPDHATTAIGRVKLGRMLDRLGRVAEGEAHLTAAYETLSAQLDAGAAWLQTARRYLADLYERTGRPDEAARLQGEIEASRRG